MTETYIVYDREHTLEEVYALGRVPSAEVVRFVQSYLTEKQMGIETLAAVARTNSDKYSGNKIPETIDFDTADRLLCATWGPFAWHSDELNDHYQSVYLGSATVNLAPLKGERRCARAGCDNTVKPHKFRPNQKYCSDSCRSYAYQIRSKGRPHHGKSMRYFCKKGRHERTPENTQVLANGTKRCIDCRREGQKRRRSRGPVATTVHGTPAAYANHGCRCEQCRYAWRVHSAKRRIDAKQRRSQ